MTIRAMGDAQGLVRTELVPEGRTVNKEMYLEIFRRLRDEVRRKCPQIWTRNCWSLLHDNAPAYRPLVSKKVPSQAQRDGFAASIILPGKS
jgi:hypothetical protein